MLEALLRHEARYWARSAAGRGLDLDVSVLRLAVAVGCLIGADSETAAGALLSRVPDLDSAERRGRVARWLHDLYPAAQRKRRAGARVAWPAAAGPAGRAAHHQRAEQDARN